MNPSDALILQLLKEAIAHAKASIDNHPDAWRIEAAQLRVTNLEKAVQRMQEHIKLNS